MLKPRIAYAGNRRIGLRVLQLLLDAGCEPVALLLPRTEDESTSGMGSLLSGVPCLKGIEFRSSSGIDLLSSLRLDYIVSVHFPYLVPPEVLALPRVGTLNLHPAYLPYNRGWHTPSWALLEGTEYGATLHWMDAGLDTGDIAIQKRIQVEPEDTAHTLYQRVLALEAEVFLQAIPLLLENRLPRVPQPTDATFHSKTDLQRMQWLELGEKLATRDLIDRLRALSTNDWNEAARFRIDNRTYLIRVEIKRA